MAQYIIAEIACPQASLDNPIEFANAIRRFDKGRRTRSLLDSVSEDDLKHFAWELRQFARFEGNIDEYYAQMCLLPGHNVQNGKSNESPISLIFPHFGYWATFTLPFFLSLKMNL